MATHRWTLREPRDLGAALAEVRMQRGRTQTDTAAAAELDRTQLAHLETGRSGRFLANVFAVLRSLDARITIEWSVADENSPPDLSPPTIADRESEEHALRRLIDQLRRPSR